MEGIPVSNPLVSVIIPIYNKANFLDNTLRSVCNQSYEHMEIIAINDGSTDDSLEIAEKWSEKYPEIRVISQENQGVSAARNRGLREMSGSFIFFLDADDTLEPHTIRKLTDCVKDKNIAYCMYKDSLAAETSSRRGIGAEGDVFVDYMYGKLQTSTGCFIFRSEFIRKEKLYFDETMRWGEDMHYFARALLLDKNVGHVSETLMNYSRGNPGGLSENSIDKLDEDLYWMDSLLDYIETMDLDPVRRQELEKPIRTYRMPAAIVYRLLLCRNQLRKREIGRLYRKHLDRIRAMRLTNGLRSAKLYLNHLKLWRTVRF